MKKKLNQSSIQRHYKTKRGFTQGLFSPKYPEKYIGNLEKIRYRSSWEMKIMMMLDESTNITKWSSEGTVIPYFSQLDNKPRKYYTDFTVELKNDLGEITQVLLEVKPLKEINPPKMPRKKTDKSLGNYARALSVYQVNMDKWKQANEYCKSNGINFLLVYQNKSKSFVFVNFDMLLNGEVILDAK